MKTANATPRSIKAIKIGVFACLYTLGLHNTMAGEMSSHNLINPKFIGSEPEQAFVRQLDKGPHFSVGIEDTSSEELAQRWQVSQKEGPVLVASDPVSSLVISQRSQWLHDLRLLLLHTSISNQGKNTLTLSKMHVLDLSFKLGENQWNSRFKELTYRDDTWYGSSYWTGPDWTRVGKNWHHPGDRTPSIRKFLVPRDGQVTITGFVRKAHLDGDGIRAWITHKGRTVWQTELEGKDEIGRAHV